MLIFPLHSFAMPIVLLSEVEKVQISISADHLLISNLQRL
jgi:hypothetical protein